MLEAVLYVRYLCLLLKDRVGWGGEHRRIYLF